MIAIPRFPAARVGALLTRHELQGVLVLRAREPRRAAAVAWDGDVATLGDRLAALLAALDVSGPNDTPRRATGITIALDTTVAQTRHLVRLPQLPPAELTTLVRANVERFFITGDTQLAVSAAEPSGAGSCWVMAVERPLLECIASACERAHVHFDGLLPERVALSAARENAPLGAILVRRDHPLRIRGPETERQRIVARRHRVVAVVALLIALLGYVVTPDVALARHAATARRSLERTTRARREAEWIARDLAATDRTLDALVEVAAERRSSLRFLAELTESLAGDASVESIELDDDGGRLLVVGASAARALHQLLDVRGVGDAAIVGGVTTNVVAGRRSERAALSFTWRGTHRDRAAATRARVPSDPAGT